jgi:outer membrane protein
LVLALVLAAFALGRMRGDRPSPAPGRPAAAPLPGPREAQASGPELPSGGCRVGFVDLQTVYNSCKQSKAFELEMTRFVKEGRLELDPLEQSLKRLQEQYQMLAPSAPERADLEKQLRQKKDDYDHASEPWERDLNRKQLKERERVYRLVREVTARVAKARNFDLVLSDIEEPHPNFSAETSRDLNEALADYSIKVQKKVVLYASREMDLTAAVLEAVNAEP